MSGYWATYCIPGIYASTFNSRQYLQSLEIPKQISYVLRGIKRAISRKLIKISDCQVSSFLKTVPGCRVSRYLIFRIWKLKFKRNAQICHWLIPLFVYCRNNCTLCCKSSKEYSENCMFWRFKVMADLWRPMLNKCRRRN